MDVAANAGMPGYGTIVVPLDGSILSESALPIAATIARASDSRMHLVRVHVPPLAGMDLGFPLPDIDEEIRQDERAHLAETAQRLAREQGVVVESQLLDVPIGSAILEYVQAAEAGLLVITTHGRTGLSRMWLGSTADWLVRCLPIPVLMLRPHDGSGALTPVLVALDGSERSERILPEAVRLARLGAGRLVLLHVVVPTIARPVPIGSPMFPPPFDENRTTESLRNAKEHLDLIAARLRQAHAGLDITTEAIADERIADAILECAREIGARVVALSSRGRGASRLLVGSVADKVLRGFDGMVLVLGPAAIRELETDYVVEEDESAANWNVRPESSRAPVAPVHAGEIRTG